jgi:hypothetical protein
MTIIKNHFEVFLVTSKKQGNGIIESKVGLYSIRPVHTYLSVKCHLWPRFRVRNSTSLRSSILFGFRHEIRQIIAEMLQNIRDAYYYRFAIYQERNGAYFEHLLH